ncbi:MAG: type II toxin-antitoxin system RelE/ParE family toxin [Cohaesibacteraceae bacterium]|nr:type II toxin-antitoxin system RelE/ParE family toxin [Cohaesibacteraceae bacterium]
MKTFTCSNAAVTDLHAIANYTVAHFGADHARHYGEGVEHCFELLAENPHAGTAMEQICPGLRCFEYRNHSVFYFEKKSGCIIMRVLHHGTQQPRQYYRSE